MRISKFMDRALFALSVPKCICCGDKLNYGEKAFCPKCYAEYNDFKTRNCSKCARILSECDCSNDFLESHFVRRVVKCYRYITINDNMPSNKLIYSLKRDNREDVLSFAADELSNTIRNSVENTASCIYTNIPRRKSAIIEFGIDHSQLLAKAVADRLSGRYIALLKSNAKNPQKSLDTLERRKNADFYLVNDIDLKGKTVIIIDDIITSGSSMANAAALVRSLGSKDIVAASLAIAYKDS